MVVGLIVRSDGGRSNCAIRWLLVSLCNQMVVGLIVRSDDRWFDLVVGLIMQSDDHLSNQRREMVPHVESYAHLIVKTRTRLIV